MYVYTPSAPRCIGSVLGRPENSFASVYNNLAHFEEFKAAHQANFIFHTKPLVNYSIELFHRPKLLYSAFSADTVMQSLIFINVERFLNKTQKALLVVLVISVRS